MINDRDSDNFDRLLKLIALKRHERPPPGFFDQFSREVMARLSAGEAERRGWWEDIFDEAFWLKRLLTAFETRPALAGGLGVALCILLISGIAYWQRPGRSPTADSIPQGQAFFAGTPKQGAPAQAAGAPSVTSTNPILEPQIPASVFEMFRPTAQPQLIVYPKNN